MKPDMFLSATAIGETALPMIIFSKTRIFITLLWNIIFERAIPDTELGDGDELWENRDLRQIIQIHSQTFELLFQFYQQGRLYFLYGNHDKVNQHPAPIGFPAIEHYSGLILQDSEGDGDLYLIHGHQADFLNCNLWRLSRLMVRYLWKPLEHFGVLRSHQRCQK